MSVQSGRSQWKSGWVDFGNQGLAYAVSPGDPISCAEVDDEESHGSLLSSGNCSMHFRAGACIGM